MAAAEREPGLFARFRGVLVRLLRAPALSERRFDETGHRLDELRRQSDELLSRTGGADATLAALRAQVDAVNVGLQRLADEQRRTRDLLNQLSVTTGHLAEVIATGPSSNPPSTTLVSVVLPVRDRLSSLRRALRSVLEQTHEEWECIVVDDGSEPPLTQELAPELADDRMTVIRLDPAGESVARNRAVEAARGEIVTFLDSDNWWLPDRLATMVASLAEGGRWAVDRQLVVTPDGQATHVRVSDQPLSALIDANFIDLGMVAVRRTFLDGIGSSSGSVFDPSLERLSDWDLVLRLAAVEPPARVPHLGQVYDERAADRITAVRPLGPAMHRIRQRHRRVSAAGLRVLVAEWHFPQVTETYIQSDIAGLRALGATVEAWSDEDVAVPYDPGIPVHRGRLEDAIAAVDPHLVLTHWLHIGRDLVDVTRRRQIPHAVRCHSFDVHDGVIDELIRRPGVVVHLFPHLATRHVGHPAVSVDPVAFDPDRVAPTVKKDRRLVFRTAAGLLTKDVEVFLLTALRCPDHRFVLNLGHTYQVEHRAEEIAARARELDAPVEILFDLDHDKAAALTEQAGIYLHTHGDSHPLGQPISIVESMATGAYVVARDLPGMREYLGGAGDVYWGITPEDRADHAATLIDATRRWDDVRWQRESKAALDVAWTGHAADDVAARLVEVWQERLGLRW